MLFGVITGLPSVTILSGEFRYFALFLQTA